MSALTVAIACLQNPRTPQAKGVAPGWIVFDMFLYLRDKSSASSTDEPDCQLATALVRYYNRGDLSVVKQDEDIYCMVVCTLARPQPSQIAAYVGDEVDAQEYNFMGDIVYLAPLPITELPCYAPYVIVSGAATNVNRAEARWHTPISQYAFNTKDAALQVHARLPDLPRWNKEKKPVPSDLSLYAGAGKLADVVTAKDSQAAAHIGVDIENIAFLGRAQQIAPSDHESGTPSTPNGKRGPKIMKRPSTPSTPTPSQPPSKKTKSS
ncbi:hypothetical protein PsYK624_118730 [Phanerochaete sordida]|uniref:Uncharacterized protein n=1 Tax=Phanerochaete sordida TaxID=48140 RepID=A0A9P3GIF9_9APHY|nr:hypothetical protein PsYK624_118730 [Phanerochaete sordida]